MSSIEEARRVQLINDLRRLERKPCKYALMWFHRPVYWQEREEKKEAEEDG